MSVFKKLGEGIADLSELNVQTFTGNIETVIDKDGGSIIDWTKLLADAKSTNGKVKLMASSVFKFDGDSNSYFDANISKDILDSHMAAVESGQTVREGLIDMFKEVLGLTK